MSSIIPLKPLRLPKSLTNIFPGRPTSLHIVFYIKKDSDDHVLKLTVKRQQTREGHRQEDADRTTFSFQFHLNCHEFQNMHPEQCNNVCIGAEKFESFKDTNSNEYQGQEGQYTVGFLLAKGHETIFFSVPKPIYPKRNSPAVKVHTEEMIIQQIIDYLTKNGYKIPEGAIIVLYSPNSPCLKKENTKDHCMLQLLFYANQWKIKYGIRTIVLFTKYWGPIGSNCSEVIQSVPDRFAEQNRKFTIKRSRKQLKNLFKHKDTQVNFSMVPEKDRNTLREEVTNISKAIEFLVNKNKSLTTHEHLHEGQKVIESCTCKPEIREKFFNVWQEEVKRQEKECIGKEWIRLENSRIVKSFLQNFNSGEKSPIQFYQIPPLMDLRILHPYESNA
ncbi:uncharacterized protein LOC118112308 isoform X2 [Hippoglossus stenolepis]|nr:uncharacterized protein LOC118112308 isoform X2 [Hippoglossus stenolepis]